MDADKMKIVLGNNISHYRRQADLTQAALAEKINYTDKAVSKWERGESFPDLPTVLQLSEIFGVTVNDLLGTGDEIQKPEKEPEAGKSTDTKTERRKANHGVIQILSSILVWFVALLVYVILSSVGIASSWVTFVYAVPVNAIVLLSLRSAWHQFNWNAALISVIVWGCLFSIYFSLLLFAHANVWKVFLLGVPGEIAIFWWFRMFQALPKEEDDE